MTRKQAEKEIRDTFTEVWADGIIKALTHDEQSVYERAYKEGYDKGWSDGNFCGKHEQEPTTKNDLGVDCISRDEVCRYVAEFVNHEFSTREEEELIDNIITGIERMPSVTPKIKPRKGEWLRMSDLSEQEDDRYKCSRCGNVIHHKNKMDLYTFNSWCGRCGSDNGRHINYEVEE